jgi:hypothetical protein
MHHIYLHKSLTCPIQRALTHTQKCTKTAAIQITSSAVGIKMILNEATRTLIIDSEPVCFRCCYACELAFCQSTEPTRHPPRRQLRQF